MEAFGKQGDPRHTISLLLEHEVEADRRSVLKFDCFHL
jgi:hypothetical protein